MGIKKLLIETIAILAIITCAVIALNSFQIHRNATNHFLALQDQYFDATYQIYQNNIIGDLLVDSNLVTDALLKEIANRRNLAVAVEYKDMKLQAGNPSFNQPGKEYKLDLGNGDKATLTFYPTNSVKAPLFFRDLGDSLFFEILIFGLGFIYLSWRFRKKVLNPLTDLVSHLKPGGLDTYEPKIETVSELKELSNTLKAMHVTVQKKAIYEAEANAAKEVAHDIRSPLATLNRLLVSLNQLPEKERVLLTNAVHRIKDVSNNLLSKHQQNVLYINSMSSQEELIPELLDSIVSEKRVQYESANINFSLKILPEAYCLFANINAINFKQAISNLVDNAVEAITENQGQITIELTKIDNGNIKLVLADNGCGISPDLIDKYLQGGATSKKNGHGMGLSSAKQMIEQWGGVLFIESEVNVGTKVIIILPQSNSANWFVNQMVITSDSTIVVLDDDDSIHGVWDKCFAEKMCDANNIKLVHFYNALAFIDFYSSHRSDNLFFLIDYNLINSTVDGLNLIEQLGIAKRSILVTNQYDDINVRSRAAELSVKILPKNYASHILVSISNNNPDYILLDDDAAVRDLWELVAEQNKKHLASFADYEKFKTYVLACAKDIVIYIDAKLSAAMQGEVVAKELFGLGYTNIYLCTGYPASNFRHVNWVRGVVGKEPPF